jgi:secreted trypsin-like serine protease
MGTAAGRWYLAVVISHSKGCDRADEAGVYVRLAHYHVWLQAALSRL